MLSIRIIVSLLLINTCRFSIAADEGVIVEMQTGQRIRANSISTDAIRPEKAILEVSNERIRLKRIVNWSRVKIVFASADLALDLKAPVGVEVKDIAESSKPIIRPNDSSTQEQYEPSAVAPDARSVQFPPPPPEPMLSVDQNPDFRPLTINSEPMELDHLPSSYCAPCFAICPIPVLNPWRDPGVVVGIRNQDGTPVSFAGNPGAISSRMETAEPRELLVTARAFNRNGLADWNSLEISFQGRTATGSPCPVRGSLKCSLWTRHARLVRAYAETYFEEPSDLVLLSSWSQFVDISDIDASGVQKVVVALPQRPADHNLLTSQFGVLAVELDIPGQGRLAATSQPIALRQMDATRSRSVVDFGESMLPGQTVSEGGNSAGYWPAPLSNQRPDSRRFTVQP